MRKLSALMLALLIVFSCAAAKPKYDFSDLTLEELAEVHRLIEEEIEDRFECEESVFPAGLYASGVTIRPGSYVLSTDEDISRVNVYLFESMADYERYLNEKGDGAAYFHAFLMHEESAFVTIENENVLFTDKAVYIKPANASWLP